MATRWQLQASPRSLDPRQHCISGRRRLPIAKHKVVGSTPITRSQKIRRLGGWTSRGHPPLYRTLYRNDGGRGVLLLRVLGDAAERRLGLLLQAQGVAVEDAPGAMPGDGHGLMRGDAGLDRVGDGGGRRVVEDEAAGVAADREARLLAGSRPRALEIAHAGVGLRRLVPEGAPAAVEDIAAVQLAGLVQALDNLKGATVER